MHDRRLPTWSAVAIGLLAGALLGALLLLVRERTWRGDWEAERQAAIEQLLAEVAVDSAVVAGLQAPAPAEPPPTITASRMNAIVAATELAAPAVVTVTVTQRVVVRDPRLSFFDFFYPERRSQRLQYQENQNYGSGVIISRDGYVVTSAHVIGNTPIQVLVTLSDGANYAAELVDVVDRFDLAFLRIQGQGFPVAELADSDQLRIGEWAIAIGSPFGQLLADTRPTVTVGVVSAVGRDIVRQSDRDRYYLGMIQTDAAINPGNSGGALVNAEGSVIGINTFIFSESGGSIGIGFAVPSNRVRWVLEEIREFGRYRPPNLGVVLRPLNSEIVQALGLTEPVGFLVRDIMEDSPAWVAGLRRFDVIQTINGQLLDSRDTVTRLFYEAMVGDRLHFTAVRDGRVFSGQIVLEEVPR